MISKIFPFLGKKAEPKRKDPTVTAEFAVHRFDHGKSNAAAVRDIGKLLAKRFDEPVAHNFGTTVKGKLSQVERALEDIGADSSLNKRREQVEVKLDFKPATSLAA